MKLEKNKYYVVKTTQELSDSRGNAHIVIGEEEVALFDGKWWMFVGDETVYSTFEKKSRLRSDCLYVIPLREVKL